VTSPIEVLVFSEQRKCPTQSHCSVGTSACIELGQSDSPVIRGTHRWVRSRTAYG
jgi:hypothetical protein